MSVLFRDRDLAVEYHQALFFHLPIQSPGPYGGILSCHYQTLLPVVEAIQTQAIESSQR